MQHWNPVLETRDLWFRYESGQDALRGLSLSIAEGDFVALVGANGSGKTTLAKHFIGLLRPTRGHVCVRGVDIAKIPVSQIAETVGFVFQNPDHQIFCNSVQDETAFALRLRGLPLEVVQERVSAALSAVGLDAMRERHPRALSLGQRQRLATASVLAMETDVVVLDEPTTGQDFSARRQIMSLATELHERGKTIVMITHDMALVAEYARRMIVLKAGEIVLDATPREGFDDHDVIATAGLSPPPVAQLAHGLSGTGFQFGALTVAELVTQIHMAARSLGVTDISRSEVEEQRAPH